MLGIQESGTGVGWEVALLAAVAAALPTIAYLAFIWWLDRHEKEPLHLLAVSFLWGALPAALLVVVLEVALDLPLRALGDATAEWRESRLLAPVVEELVKGSALLGLAARVRREFNGVLDGIVYGAVIGLGFALTENFFAFLAAFSSGSAASGLVVVTLRALIFGLNHPLYSALFGAGLGWMLYRRRRRRNVILPLLCLCGAIGLHLLHNALAVGAWTAWWSVPLATLADWSGLALIAAIVTLTWRHEQHWIEEGLGEEVRHGVVTQAEYELVTSYRRRVAAEWRALRRSGWRGYRTLAHHSQMLTKLAFARYHLRHGGLPAERSQEVAALQWAVQRGRLALARQQAGHPYSEEAERV